MSNNKLRIFIVHNYYQHQGGEDIVFENEAEKLSENHNVRTFTAKNSSGKKGFIQFLKYPWNQRATRKIIRKIEQFQPDVVHIHNLHYAIGLLLIRRLNQLQIPHVLTLHNYRILCPSATLYHKGELFKKSLKQSFPYSALFRRVHNQSFLKTFWIAFTYFLHKKIRSWHPHTHFIALTDFAKNIFVNSSLGVPASRFFIKANFVERPEPHSAELIKRGNHFLYVGRLSEEKGILRFINSIKDSPHTLKIIGAGPHEKEITAIAKQYPKKIIYLGYQNREAIFTEMSLCTALIMPSVWYEGMPLTLLEAFASSTPVLGSNLGVLKELISPGHTGLLFDPYNTKSIQKAADKWLSLNYKDKISKNCLSEYKKKYSPEVIMNQLINIYQEISIKKLEKNES